MGFPGDSDDKESPYNAGDSGSIPGSGRSPGGGNGNSPQYSCLGDPMGREAWPATVNGTARIRHDLESKPQPQCGQLSKFTYHKKSR